MATHRYKFSYSKNLQKFSQATLILLSSSDVLQTGDVIVGMRFARKI